MSDDLSTKLTAEFDGTQAEQGLVKLGATAKKAGRDIEQAGHGAGKAFGSVGTGAEDGSKRADRATKSLIDSIQRTTAAANAGAKGTADYYSEIARIRGVSQDALKPYLADLRKAQGEQDKATDSVSKWNSAATSLGGVLGRIGAAVAGGAFYAKFISETIDAANEQAQLQAVLKSTSEAAGFTAEALNEMAESMSKKSVFSPGEINQAQTRMLSYSNVVGQQFPKAMQATIDMAQRMGMSVTQSAETIGKALDVPSEGLSALTKQGFRFTEAEKLLVEQLEETGNKAEAQAIILKSLESSYGGAAEAARGTFGGALTGLKNTINDLMTGSGGSVDGLTQSVNDLSATLSSAETKQAFATIVGLMVEATNVAARLANAMAMLSNGNLGGALLGGDKLNNPQSALVEIESKIAEKQRQLDAFGVGRTGVMAWMKRGYSADDIAISNKQLAFFKQQRDVLLGMVSTEQYGDNAPDPAEWNTEPVKAYGKAISENTEWLKKFGTAAQKAQIEIKEWEKKLGAPLSEEMKSSILKSYEERGSGGAKGVGQQEKAVSGIRARIQAEEELIKRLQDRGAAAQDLSESDKLVGKLQEEIAGTTNKRTKANLEGQLAEALVWQETQKNRTELEKQIKAQEEAEKGYRKYIDSIYKSADAIGDMADQQDAANASFGKSKVAIAELAAEQAKMAAANAKDAGPWTPEHVAALKAVADQHERYVESLRKGEYIAANRKYDDDIRAARDELQVQQYSMSLLGEQELKRNKMIAVRKSEIKLARELADIEKTYMGRTDETSIKQRADLERKAQIRATEELQVELGQIQDQYVTEQVQKYDQIFSQGFADMLNGNEGSWKSFTKSLTTTFKTQVADQIYQMFARPIVVQLVGSLLGMTGGAGGLLGGLLGGGSGGGGGVMGLLSNGSSAYSLYSGEGLLGQGSRYVANMFGFGGAAPWQAAGAQASGAVTMPVTGGLGGAAPGSTSFMGLNGGYAAAGVMMIPLIAAYLGGMFKEERQVGAGITGELGGDLYGYQLMRESGSLFGGPKYRYLVAEKEIEQSKAEIERLKKEIADNPDDKRNAYRERQIQQQYSRLEMLSQYDGAIEGSKGPIKVLQDAFLGMREDTASRADSLGLDGDAIRAMKVTLGLDEIHPDTGGKGLELTGLTQEEASAKVQQALAQANEELARSVLGKWETQTREVTRMVWDNVELPSDGDTQQYGRVGREVTETVTEQVFVMSEYVRAGETAVQALTRLSDSLYSVNSVFDMLGVTLMDTSLAGADLASDIIDAFGGGDKFAAATGNYYDKFYTDQEKVKNQTRLLNDQLKKLGIETMPASREALREYINGIDLSTEEGRKLYASLLGLVDVFDMIYTSAENIASLKQDLNLQLLRANGNDAEALRLEREKQIKELEKYNDPELVRMQREVWAAEDKKKAEEEAKQALESAKALAMSNLQAAIGREKEHWSTFAKTAQEKLTQAASYFDMFTGAAKSLRGSVEDVATYQAAAGMVYIEQALADARRGLGLGDYDQAKTAVEAASSGLVMGNYATQAELDYDKKMLAAQLEELGEFAGVAKTDAQKQIDLANDQIKRLDDTLSYWKDYGQDQIDATLSVTDAVNALFKLLDPKEQERIKQEEAAKAGLGGGSTPGYTPSGGGSLGGTVAGSNRVTVVGLTADGRAIFSNGEIGKYAAGEYAYNSTGQMNSNGYSLAEFEKYKASGEFEWVPEKNEWRKRASFAVGTNYVPYDMQADIHQGERIIPAADNRAIISALQSRGSDSSQLSQVVAELKSVKAELQAMKGGQGELVDQSKKLGRLFSNVTDGGDAMRSRAVA
ncbi:phage tail length tape measure family protein [Comamonas sp.]|uniref:phage tail length tape measure family protein n=1 Tax=Comamonas sp. TaxID=34028 RepID=UPI003D0CD214